MKKIYLTFDIGGTFIKWAIANSDFEILENGKFPFDAMNKNCKKEMIKEIGQKAIELNNKYKIEGIAVSTAGDVNSETTEIIGATPNHKNYTGTNFKKELSKYIDLPFAIGNDANLAVLGESVKGQLKDVNDGVMITLGTDIGSGIVINKKLFEGFTGCAANAGYLNVLGRRFGTYFSAIGLVRLVKEMKNITIKEPVDILNDKKLSDICDYWYKGLSYGIANIITLLCPQKIILGGGLSESGKVDLKKIKKYVNEVLIEKHLINACKIEISKHGNYSAIYGCVKLLNDKLM